MSKTEEGKRFWSVGVRILNGSIPLEVVHFDAIVAEDEPRARTLGLSMANDYVDATYQDETHQYGLAIVGVAELLYDPKAKKFKEKPGKSKTLTLVKDAVVRAAPKPPPARPFKCPISQHCKKVMTIEHHSQTLAA